MDNTVVDYDEFAMLKQHAEHEGIAWHGQPEVERRSFKVSSGQMMSAVVWGSDEPELVFLHGGSQDAHTWDSVALALGVPAIAIDLPGHGQSDWREDQDYGAWSNAEAVADVMDQTTSHAKAVVGMSSGGLTTIALASQRPELVRRAVIIDITPSVSDPRRASQPNSGRGALRTGPRRTYESVDELVAIAEKAFPDRRPEFVRNGVMQNARQLDDGRWDWRYDRTRQGGGSRNMIALWEDLAGMHVPLMFVRGTESEIVEDFEVVEFLRLQPETRVEMVEGAGHNVQDEKPVALAALIENFVATTP